MNHPPVADAHWRIPDVSPSPDAIFQPLAWSKPRRVTVAPDADLFGDSVPVDVIGVAWAVMSLASRHRFLLRTSNPQRMRTILGMPGIPGLVQHARLTMLLHPQIAGAYGRGPADEGFEWPLPNVLLGVPVKDQASAARNIPPLLETPARGRFIVSDPLTGPLELRQIATRRPHVFLDVLAGDVVDDRRPGEVLGACPGCVDWVVVGEQQHRFGRPVNPAWIESLIEQVGRSRALYYTGTDHPEWPRRLPVL